MKIAPTHDTLGAEVEGLDLVQPLGRAAFRRPAAGRGLPRCA